MSFEAARCVNPTTPDAQNPKNGQRKAFDGKKRTRKKNNGIKQDSTADRSTFSDVPLESCYIVQEEEGYNSYFGVL